MTAVNDHLLAEINKIKLIDPHSHINPHKPASTSLNDLLGYHYYTELAHSAGLAKPRIAETRDLEQCVEITNVIHRLSNTRQYQWLIELARDYYGFSDHELTPSNVSKLYEAVSKAGAQPTWADQVLAKANVEAVFLTNDFDDPLTGFDTNKYIPCLRTDDLVFHWTKPEVRERFSKVTGCASATVNDVTTGIAKLFDHFIANNARACAISLPPWFAPEVPETTALTQSLFAVQRGVATDADQVTIANGIFHLLADQCAERGVPFDLMIGVNRQVYPGGVYQGQDLFDQRVSLYQYRHLFNRYPQVTFPISVLSHPHDHELMSYAWIFPNVVTNGHWWYSNLPAHIEPSLRGRLDGVPMTKQIGYYSDAYKLEFIKPKFDMYRRILANVLATDFVIGRGWSEKRAIELAYTILRGNVERIFPGRG